ncbi:contactin-associated protein-like 2 [Pecten maximus]|uniref:contactin-associated protein-like 2 n=1 Tax=Pecten maximus TaxID=6579 RepID=UPI001458B3E3|nr:contactin-associated protein-like 2 [Pecten maximus]
MERVIQILALLMLRCVKCSPCDVNLVTGTYGVSDNAFSASSTYGACDIYAAGINSSNAWCPKDTDNEQYLQVEFQTDSELKTIQTRGRDGYDQWVTLYSVNTSMDGITWSYILSSTGDVQMFPGNSDRNTIVTNEIEGKVVAKYIRVILVSGYGDHKRSMRLEVQGCPVSYTSNRNCQRWEAKLGSTGNVFPIIEDTDASNQGLCGLKCFKQKECNRFLFEIGSARCRLLTSTSDVWSKL